MPPVSISLTAAAAIAGLVRPPRVPDLTLGGSEIREMVRLRLEERQPLRVGGRGYGDQAHSRSSFLIAIPNILIRLLLQR